MLVPSMINYIMDQGNALRRTFDSKNVFCDVFEEIFRSKDIKKIYFLGSGTSYHVALAAKFYFEKYLNVEAEAVIPTYFKNYIRLNNNDVYLCNQVLIVGITQSGTSVSTIEAIEYARKKGYFTVAVTEDLSSQVTLVAECVVKLTCGKEEIPVETRGYSVSVFEMYLIAIELAKNQSVFKVSEYEILYKKIDEFLNHYDSIVDYVDSWYKENKRELLELTKGCIVGYGINTCTCNEAVLKMFETFKKPLDNYDIEEMIHGPHMAFDEDTYVFIVAGPGNEFDRLPLFYKWFDDNEITKHIFIISTLDTKHSEKDCLIKFETNEDLSPLVYTLPFQIIAARNCIEMGINTSVRPARRKAFAHIYKEE